MVWGGIIRAAVKFYTATGSSSVETVAGIWKKVLQFGFDGLVIVFRFVTLGQRANKSNKVKTLIPSVARYSVCISSKVLEFNF